jgi:hypothetical protein
VTAVVSDQISWVEDLRVITVRDFCGLAARASAWNELARNAPQVMPSLLPGWVDAFLRHRLKPEERWLCCFAYHGNRLVGVLPVIVKAHPVLGCTWPILRTPSDAHTPSGDVLLAPDNPARAFRALLGELRRAIPNHVGLYLKRIRRNSPIWEAIRGGIDDYTVRKGIRSQYSFLDVQGDFEVYFGGLGHMRRDVRRFKQDSVREGP